MSFKLIKMCVGTYYPTDVGKYQLAFYISIILKKSLQRIFIE